MIKIKNQEVTFFMPMKKLPTATAQQKQFRVIRGANPKSDRVAAYDPDNVKRARLQFEKSLSPHIPEKPIINKPIYLRTMWLYGTKDKKRIGKLKTTRPDVTNIIKLLEDTMTKLGFWKDDSLISIGETHKYWAEENKSGILVTYKVINQE